MNNERQSHHQHAQAEHEREKNDHNKSGNLKNDPEKAREAGHKGGSQSHGHKERE